MPGQRVAATVTAPVVTKLTLRDYIQGLADKASVSRKTINTVENGVFVPSTVLALELARALDTTVEAFWAPRR